MIVCGIDPGASKTGVCVLNGNTIISTHTDNSVTLEAFTVNIHDFLTTMKTSTGLDVVFVEDVNAPSWHYSRAGAALKPEYLLETAKKIGVIVSICHMSNINYVRVPPNKHGANLLGAYPDELVSTRVRSKNNNWKLTVSTRDALHHQRAAYDVIKTGLTLMKHKPT